MNTKQAAKYLGISYYYLRNLGQGMYRHSGPIFKMIKTPRGLTRHYLQEDLNKWMRIHAFKNKRFV